MNKQRRKEIEYLHENLQYLHEKLETLMEEEEQSENAICSMVEALECIAGALNYLEEIE